MAAKVECGECGKPVKEKFHDQHMERMHGRRIPRYRPHERGDDGEWFDHLALKLGN